jgi:hypothetical protein
MQGGIEAKKCCCRRKKNPLSEVPTFLHRQTACKKKKPAPAAEDDFLNGLDEFDDDYGEAALPPVPSQKRSSKKTSKSSKRKKAQSSIWKNPGVIIGGSVVGVLLLVGVGLFASGVFSSDAPAEDESTEVADADDENANKGKRRGGKKGAVQTAQRSGKQLNLAWLPADTELIVSIRVADLWNSPLIQSLVEKPEMQQNIGLIREGIGLEPGDIESITLGVAELSETAKSMAPDIPDPTMMMMAGMSPDFNDVPGAFVIRTSKPVDIQKILSFIRQSDESVADKIQKTQHNGKEYFRMPDPDVENSNEEDSEFIALFAADSKTIVFGPEEHVKTAMNNNGRAGDSSRFAFVDAGQHLLIAFVPSDLSAFNENLAAIPNEDSSPGMKISEALNGKLRGVAIGMTLNEGLSLQLDTNMQDSQAAKKVSTALSDIVQEGLTSLAEAESTVPPNFKKYITIATKILENANTSTNKTVAQVDLEIPLTSLMTLQSLPQDIMASMFSGGGLEFGPPGGEAGTVVVPSLQEKPKPAKPIKAIDLEGFNKSWQTDVNLTNQPAGDALKNLAGEMGLTPESDSSQNALLSKQVTVNLQKKSRLEAVEAICRQIDVHPIYESKTEFTISGDWITKELVRFESGPRPYPVQFAGPFLIAVTGLQDKAPNPTGSVSLQIVATNLPESVVSRFRSNHMGPATVAAVSGPQGQSLRDVEGGQVISGFGEKTATGNFIQTVAIPLKDLLRDVTAIKTISGKVEFDVPTEIKTLKIDTLTQGAVKKDSDLTLTLKTIKLDDDNSSIQFELTGIGDRFKSANVIVELRDSNGKLLEFFGSSGSGFGEKFSFDYQVEGKPASVTLKVITQLADMNYDFAFNDIPLTSYAKMPVKITPAKFPGHDTPVSLEFVKITGEDNFRKVQFKLVNHSDKGIDKIDMKLVYLDANGKALKYFPSGYSGTTQFGPEGQQIQEPAVKKKATKQIEVTAFFMPEETKTVEVELRRVRFVDAETWQASEKQAASPAEKAAGVKTVDETAVKKAITPTQHELGDPVVNSGRSGGKLLQFNGKDAFIAAAAIPFDSYNTLTIEAWVKDWKGPILCQGKAGDPENSIWISTGLRGATNHPYELCGWESGEGKNCQFSVGDKLPTSWNHLALVYDGKQQLIFVNGRLIRRTEAPKPGPLNKTRQFCIGVHDYGRKQVYGSGFLRSVRVSKTARYAVQFTPVQKLTADGDTVLLYNFSRGQGTRVSDKAGGKHDGTIHGAVWVET